MKDDEDKYDGHHKLGHAEVYHVGVGAVQPPGAKQDPDVDDDQDQDWDDACSWCWMKYLN